MTLLQLVESLEMGLTDSKSTSQKEALQSLLDGLRTTPVEDIYEKEVDYLVDFLAARLTLADPDIICLLLDGFLWLAHSKPPGRSETTLLNPTQAVRCLEQGVFQHLAVQSMVKRARLRVFKLLHCFLNGSQMIGLQTMGHRFVRSYIQAVDGEKDPDNLQLIFPMNVILMEQFPIDQVKETFFEVMAVYFPVDFFASPAEGNRAITRSNLSEALHHCLFTSRSWSAPYLLPLLCEKADSDWSQAQLDALSLLADCLHGRLQCMNKEIQGALECTDPNIATVPLHHLTCYLVLIVPLLVKLANRSRSRAMESVVQSCLTGLVNAYVTQTSDDHQLRDFVVVVLKGFGFPIDDTSSSVETTAKQSPSPPEITPSLSAHFTDMLRHPQCNTQIREIFLSYLVTHFCKQLLCLNGQLIDYWSELEQWSSSLELACEFIDAAFWRVDSFTSQTSSPVAMSLTWIHGLQTKLVDLLSQARTLLISNDSKQLESLRLHLTTVLTLTSLSIRLSGLEHALGQNIQTETLQVGAVCLAHLILFEDQSVDSSLKQCPREAILSALSRLYAIPCVEVTDELNRMLLGRIQVAFTEDRLVSYLVQHLACTNLALQDGVISWLNAMQRTKESENDPTWASMTIQLVHSITQAALHTRLSSEITMDRLTCFLTDNLTRLVQELSQQQAASTCLSSLLDHLERLFRIATSLSSFDIQSHILEACQSIASNQSEWIVIWCAILKGLHPKVIASQNSISQMLNHLVELGESVDCKTASTNRSLQMTIAQAYASLVNKCDETQFPAVIDHMTQTLKRLWPTSTPNSADQLKENSNTFDIYWLPTSLHALIARPVWNAGSQLLLDHVLTSLKPESCAAQKHLISCLTDMDLWAPLCSQPEVGSPYSELCHWRRTELMPQKVYQLIAIPLAAQIDCISSMRSKCASGDNTEGKLTDDEPMEVDDGNLSCLKELRDAYLSVYLQLAAALPALLVVDHLKQLIRYALLAITSGEGQAVQLAGLRAFSSLAGPLLISSVDGTNGTAKSSRLDANDADDLFLALSRLERCGSACDTKTQSPPSDAKTSARIRYAVTHCLAYLVHLPAEVIQRHRNPVVLPLLTRLVDDSCRAVRLEAARAHNAWLLLT